MWGLRDWCMIVYLLVGSIWDLRKKEVSVWYLASGTILVLINQIFWREEPVILRVFGALIGGIFLVFSKLTKEALGYADSWIILILGMYLGVWKLFAALGIAFLSATVIAGIGMAGKRLKRKSRIPFLPFLAIGCLGVYGW